MSSFFVSNGGAGPFDCPSGSNTEPGNSNEGTYLLFDHQKLKCMNQISLNIFQVKCVCVSCVKAPLAIAEEYPAARTAVMGRAAPSCTAHKNIENK